MDDWSHSYISFFIVSGSDVTHCLWYDNGIVIFFY